VTEALEKLTGSSHTKLVVVEEPRVGKHTHEERAQLRSLPLFSEFGFERFLHTPLWDNDFRMVEYEYLDPNDLAVDSLGYPLVHLVSQQGLTEYPVSDGEVDRQGEQHVLHDIIRARDEEDVYVLVTDTNAPRIPAYAPQRPLTDEYGPVTTVNYENLLEQTVRQELNSALPLNKTKNYFFHKVSDCHRQVGAPAETLVELFDYEVAPPNSPVWGPLYYFVEHDLQQLLDRYTERIRETLRSWLERGDVQKIANEMDAMLARCEYRKERLDEEREQNTDLYDTECIPR
jgi:hypothetical protein